MKSQHESDEINILGSFKGYQRRSGGATILEAQNGRVQRTAARIQQTATP
jgi:hypothetical protein